MKSTSEIRGGRGRRAKKIRESGLVVRMEPEVMSSFLLLSPSSSPPLLLILSLFFSFLLLQSLSAVSTLLLSFFSLTSGRWEGGGNSPMLEETERTRAFSSFRVVFSVIFPIQRREENLSPQ